jgi:lysophospholipase L1-like esterase
MAQSYTILCIGDSHTAGFPAHDPLMGGNPESSYQFWLKKGLLGMDPAMTCVLINEGMCGDTAAGIVERLRQSLNVSSYQLVILAGGTNDLGMTDEEQIFYNLETGYAACGEKGIPVIAPGIPPISISGYASKVIALNSKISACAARHENIFFADWFAALEDEHGHLRDTCDSGDGVHLSVAGYKRIGLLMAPLVKQALTGC